MLPTPGSWAPRIPGDILPQHSGLKSAATDTILDFTHRNQTPDGTWTQGQGWGAPLFAEPSVLGLTFGMTFFKWEGSSEAHRPTGAQTPLEQACRECLPSAWISSILGTRHSLRLASMAAQQSVCLGQGLRVLQKVVALG